MGIYCRLLFFINSSLSWIIFIFTVYYTKIFLVLSLFITIFLLTVDVYLLSHYFKTIPLICIYGLHFGHLIKITVIDNMYKCCFNTIYMYIVLCLQCQLVIMCNIVSLQIFDACSWFNRVLTVRSIIVIMWIRRTKLYTSPMRYATKRKTKYV